MPIKLTEPVASVYPYIWFNRVLIDAPNPNADATIYAEMVPYRIVEATETAPQHAELQVPNPSQWANSQMPEGVPNPVRTMTITNLFGAVAGASLEDQAVMLQNQQTLAGVLEKATTVQKMAIATQAVMAALEAAGRDGGLI